MSSPVVATGTGHYLEQLLGVLAERGASSLVVQLGHRVVEIQCCCPALRDHVLGHLAHLRSKKPADSVLILVEKEHASTVSPSIDWDWMGWNFRDDVGSAQFLAHSQTLLVRSRERSVVAYVSRMEPASQWEAREHLRLSFQWTLGFLGIDAIHGATLGRGDRGVFLTGRGGSGKSTLVAAGIRAGFTTVGEDFLLLSPANHSTPEPVVHSFFHTGKLEPSSPAHTLFSSEGTSSDDKTLVDLNEFSSESVVPSQRIAAAVSLSVAESTTLASSSLDQFRAALLPHSAPLNLFPQRMAQTVAQTLETIPLYTLTSGPLLVKTLHILDELISS